MKCLVSPIICADKLEARSRMSEKIAEMGATELGRET